MRTRAGAARQEQMRLRIAQLAARLMVEHGIRDHALAKRKAARQLGAPDSHSLPNNDEIDAALRDYHALYGRDDHAEMLRAQRSQALEALQALHRFDPVLTGAVLDGTAAGHAHIEIELYADASKELEQFLLNQGASFKVADRRGREGFLIHSEPCDILVTVLPLASQHAVARGREDGLKRANAMQLRKLMDETAEAG